MNVRLALGTRCWEAPGAEDSVLHFTTRKKALTSSLVISNDDGTVPVSRADHHCWLAQCGQCEWWAGEEESGPGAHLRGSKDAIDAIQLESELFLREGEWLCLYCLIKALRATPATVTTRCWVQTKDGPCDELTGLIVTRVCDHAVRSLPECAEHAEEKFSDCLPCTERAGGGLRSAIVTGVQPLLSDSPFAQCTGQVALLPRERIGATIGGLGAAARNG